MRISGWGDEGAVKEMGKIDSRGGGDDVSQGKYQAPRWGFSQRCLGTVGGR